MKQVQATYQLQMQWMCVLQNVRSRRVTLRGSVTGSDCCCNCLGMEPCIANHMFYYAAANSKCKTYCRDAPAICCVPTDHDGSLAHCLLTRYKPQFFNDTSAAAAISRIFGQDRPLAITSQCLDFARCNSPTAEPAVKANMAKRRPLLEISNLMQHYPQVHHQKQLLTGEKAHCYSNHHWAGFAATGHTSNALLFCNNGTVSEAVRVSHGLLAHGYCL